MNGSAREAVPAVRDGDRWVSARPLAEGESAYVATGCARDRYDNHNGAPSAVVGAAGVDATGECAAAAPPGNGTGLGPAGATPQGESGGDANGRSGCVSATGSLRGRRVGRAVLGRTRERNRGAFGSHAVSRRTTDRFCFSDGRHLRIGYPSRALLGTLSVRERRRVRGRAIFLSTSSSRYSAGGIRHGDTLAALAARGGRIGRHRVGSNDWYVRRARRASLLFKLRDGRVREVGLADRPLTTGRARTARFLGSFE